ncbi:hypothetical protein ABL78_0317 [Leptomonas seymouri]|uniref:Flagellum targeting protein kharon1 n=1 Tax=Leptomonas seymouri TaxID=5684 RepID=A0A0N0P9C6_LEPSE|nr:hypothetical protein ABL78_0317 [Leptomonas seymouri]|eukprot:KPI90557.1 hypothetical protein ABL78_0317 [Leptomonas seymouri]
MSNDSPRYLSARQRARNCSSGVNVSRVLRGQPPLQEGEEMRTNVGRRHGNGPHENFSSAREFFSGPRQPPRQCSGIRRNPDANRDTVGHMMTDAYLMGSDAKGSVAGQNGEQSRRAAAARDEPASQGAQPYGVAAKRGEGATRARNELNAKRAAAYNNTARAPNGSREGITYNCIVTAAEKEWRSGVKITHPQGPMDVPYFEDNDPRPARDVPTATGKRRVRPPYKDAKMFGQMALLPEGEEGKDNEKVLQPCHKKANKANESVDVLNLHCYSAEELSEKPQPHKQLGPRKYVAPDMPPRKPPMIHPINTVAKQEHDVLGTGRWGVPEKEHPHGLARGSCRPPHDTANLFGGDKRKRRALPVPTDSNHPSKVLSKKNAGSPELLRYYDPNVDPKPVPNATKRNGQRCNLETRELLPSERRPTGKGRGEFAKNSHDSVVLAYA